MRLYFVLIATWLWCSTVMAQNCSSILLGEVVDFHNNSPLNNATIHITGKNIKKTSDKSGKFNFKGLCDGVIELEISHPDCKSKFITITINGNTYKKILLEHHLEELNEVEVIGKTKNTTNSSQEEKLALENIEKFSGNALGDALKNISGVSSLNTGANIVKPIIQGLSGSRVLILNNNVRMQDMEWGEEHAPNIDINSIQDISVIKGSGAIEYGGDALGGVIVLNPLRIARADSLYGKTQLNLSSNGRGGNLTTTLIKSFDTGFYVKAHGSLKRLGDLEAPDYFLTNTGIKESGASINIGKRDFLKGWEAYYSYFNTNIGILSASHIGNVDDLITSINSTQPNIINDFSYNIQQPNQEVTHHLAKLSYYKRFTGFGKVNLQYDFQNNRRFEYDVRIGERANKPALDLELSNHSFSSTVLLDSKDDLKLKLGTLGRFQSNFANPLTGVRRLIPDYEKYDFGAFALGTYEINTQLIIDAGSRYDFTHIDAKKFYRTSRWQERNYNLEFNNLVIEDLGTQLLVNPVFNYHNFSATTGLQYNFDNTQKLRFNYSLAQRAPNASELFSDGLHHSAARIELGDLRIESETSSKISASYELNKSKWGLNIAPYINTINNFIVLEPNGVEFTIRGAFPVWSYRQTKAQLVGVDFSLYNNWTSKISTNHKVSWLQGTDQSTDNTPIINIPATNITNTIEYTNTKWKNLNITLESQYVFEQQRFPPNIFVFSPEQQKEVVLAINTPPKAYHLLALDTKLAFAIKNTNDFKIGLRITNLLNTDYRDYLNRQRYFVDNMGRNISLRLIYNY